MTEQKMFQSEKWKLAYGLNHTDMHTYARTRMHTHTSKVNVGQHLTSTANFSCIVNGTQGWRVWRLTIIFCDNRNKTALSCYVGVCGVQRDSVHLVPLRQQWRRQYVRLLLKSVDTMRVGMKWMACLNFLNAFPHRDGPHAHQWVWLYTESPLLTFLLLCVADTAPSHDAVLQGTSCTESLSKLH